ncbi:membrane lipoprotein lipid attachment site-containing protein [Dongia deserti]|uniref:membrane lipoprotein lipid attachment site-containing protein n=1 Tax=Dongia deserti TaxID=2268030 RepID=UPI000E65236C|nr:membrane lipoprotein lipid attachment site-containing protein [Dongia deserti]
MRRTILPIFAMLLLAACSSNGGGSGYGGTGTSYTDAHFLKDDPTVIELKVRDPLPVTQVVLIDPTGAKTEAYDIERDRQTYRSGGGPRPNVGVGVFGGSSGRIGTGVGIGFPIFSGQSGATNTVVDSTAKVKISNPVLYRSTWQNWKLRAELDDGRTKRTIEMVPPKPL